MMTDGNIDEVTEHLPRWIASCALLVAGCRRDSCLNMGLGINGSRELYSHTAQGAELADSVIRGINFDSLQTYK
jgi:hypothetical protein